MSLISPPFLVEGDCPHHLLVCKPGWSLAGRTRKAFEILTVKMAAPTEWDTETVSHLMLSNEFNRTIVAMSLLIRAVGRAQCSRVFGNEHLSLPKIFFFACCQYLVVYNCADRRNIPHRIILVIFIL
jgi:hypothetical protein